MATEHTPIYMFVEATPIYDLAEHTAVYDFNWFVIDIAAHSHGHFVIPVGLIDGLNKTFKVGGRQFEVMLNGLNHPYTRSTSGFTLDSPPHPGDFLWCEIIV